jgi:hypothetical protein
VKPSKKTVINQLNQGSSDLTASGSKQTSRRWLLNDNNKAQQ